VEKWNLEKLRAALDGETFAIFGVVEGAVSCAGHVFERGVFFLVPAGAQDAALKPVGEAASVVRITLPLPKRP
jgi:hypothetical protein